MNQNDSLVVPDSAHAAALSHVENVERRSVAIARLMGNPLAPNRADLLKSNHASLGRSLKLAEVHATLAVAEELAEIRRLMISGAVTL